MNFYLFIKTIHIISATVLLGTGAGIAFFMWRTWQTGETGLIAGVSRIVVLADFVFTLPAVVVQFLSGVWLAKQLDLALLEGWIGLTLVLYLLIGACWLPVVWLQVQISRLASDAHQRGIELPSRCFTYYRIWFALGWPAFIGVLVIVWLMVHRQVPFT